jgi:hypothetical protein
MTIVGALPRAAIAALIACSATAAETEAPGFNTTRVEYRLYSRALGDVGFPTPADTKLTVLFSGGAAKDLFDHLRKDRHDACAARQQARYRATPGQGLVCLRYQDASYSCGLGVDLNAGRLSVGLIC